MKPWSRRKRIKVIFSFSLVILLTALILGTIIYGLSQALKLTDGGSIKKKVLNQALNDPALTEAYITALTTKSCRNETLGFELIFDSPVKLIEDTQDKEYTRFEVTGSMGAQALVMISRRPQAKEEVVNQIIASLSGVETNTLARGELQTTSVWGERNLKPYQAYVLARDTNFTYLIEYYPADSAGLAAVRELAGNFNLLRR